jgi:uncharacterized ferritin-like protein (DUF455 family)
MSNFFSLCLNLIQQKDPVQKCLGSKELYAQLINSPEKLSFAALANIQSISDAGRPERPQLVPPLEVPKRSMATVAGHASLIHALAHIEFNAINLALDACYRYQDMPSDYYQDWLQVAAEEAYHFELLDNHLITLGYRYGDFAAHNGLWEMAHKTENSLLARMGMIPRLLEARGIDAIPVMQTKLDQLRDSEAIKILDIIHQDEIKHVSYGDKWFKYLCQLNNLDVEATYFSLMQRFNAPKIRGNFNRADRKKAGFSDSELDHLIALTKDNHEKKSSSHHSNNI